MNTKLFVLPALCLGGAAFLLAPVRSSQAFSKIGGSLGETQRDVRLFDNFLDSTANNNVTPHAQFPGYTGAELAIWKGIVEWGSGLHGDGTGDGVGVNPLGSGAANFDAMWAGNAAAVGTSNQNIVSSLADCGGSGTLAFTETPISDGWRIRFCDEWTWDDGPGSISNRWDIQGIMAHEYGHAIGLGHSGSSGATMWPSVSPGSTAIRSITADDTSGVQCVYGLASGTKPVIVATVADTGTNTITIYGSEFSATGNEVWFTNEAVTATNVNPIVEVTGVSSSSGGTVITVTIPAEAGPGDVIVNESGVGSSTVSNAWPTDLVGTFGDPPGPHPDITNVTPSSIDALIPGTAEAISITGANLDLTTSVLLDDEAIPSSRWTIVNPTSITLDMPQAGSLGAHTLSVSDGVQDDFGITIVAPASPKLEWGNGDALNVVDNDVGLDVIVSGTPGQVHAVRGSPNGIPLLDRLTRLTTSPNLVDAGAYVIPAKGWHSVHIGGLPDPAIVGVTWFAKSFAIVAPRPWPASNDQSITLVQ